MNEYHSKHLVALLCKLLILTIYLGLDLLGVSDGQLLFYLQMDSKSFFMTYNKNIKIQNLFQD